MESATAPATATTAVEKKVNKGKKKQDVKKMYVPHARLNESSRPWARHVYLIIREFAPSLLKEEAVIDAYNAFAERLEKYEGVLVTYVPARHSRYKQGIVFESLTFHRYLDGAIPGYFRDETELWRRPELKQVHAAIIEDIKNAYKPLYDLFKRVVVPPMEKKYHDEHVKARAPRIRTDIEGWERAMDHEKTRHERAVEYEEKRHKETMERYHEVLHQNIQDLHTLLHAFTPTVFPDTD